MKRTLSILLAAALCLCILAGCGKKEEEASGAPNAAGTYEIPTEYSYTLTAEGLTASIKLTVDFQQSQLTVSATTTLSGLYEGMPYEETDTDTTDFLLDSYGNVVREVDHSSYNGAHSVWDYAYGESGRPTESSFHTARDATDTLIVYASRGDTLISTRYTSWGVYENDECTYIYDSKGRLTREAGSTGWSESYEYDEHGNVTKQVHTYIDGDTTVQEMENHYTGGRLTGVTLRGDMGEFDGYVEEIHLTVGGYKSFQMTEGQYRCALLLPMNRDERVFRGASSGGEVRYADGTPLKEVLRDGNGVVQRETYFLPKGEVDYFIDYRYEDGVLRRKSYRTANGGETLALVYDEAGALCGSGVGDSIDYNGGYGGDNGGWDDDDGGWTYDPYTYEDEYDGAGRLVKRHAYDADGVLWNTEEYDERGELIWRTEYSYFIDSDALGGTQEYDGAGILRKFTHYRENGTLDRINEYDEDGWYIKQTLYDEAGNLSGISEYDEDGAEIKWTAYYENGNLCGIFDKDARGNVLRNEHYNEDGSFWFLYEYEYDEAGKQRKLTSYNENGSLQEILEYDENEDERKRTVYDENGGLLYVSEYGDGGLHILTFYHENGNPSQYSESINGEYIKYIQYYENGNMKQLYEYDENGTLRKEVDYLPDGSVDVWVEYDENGDPVP